MGNAWRITLDAWREYYGAIVIDKNGTKWLATSEDGV
jgi:hypothetical protein